MGVKEDFFAWKEQYKADNGKKPSKAMQESKINELKRGTAEAYTPEKNVERAIKSAESEGKPDVASMLRAMQKGKLGEKAREIGVKQTPYGERYTGMFGQPLSATEAKQREALYPRTMASMVQGSEFPVRKSC